MTIQVFYMKWNVNGRYSQNLSPLPSQPCNSEAKHSSAMLETLVHRLPSPLIIYAIQSASSSAPADLNCDNMEH